jgi:hypothetical protein
MSGFVASALIGLAMLILGLVIVYLTPKGESPAKPK